MTAKERIFAIGLPAGGLGCAGIGVLQAQETADFVQKAESVPGKILSLNRRIGQYEQIERRHKAGGFARTYFRTVVFRTREGMQVVEQSYKSSSSRRRSFTTRHIPADEAVVILYNRADPKDFRLDTRWGVWGYDGLLRGDRAVPACVRDRDADGRSRPASSQKRRTSPTAAQS